MAHEPASPSAFLAPEPGAEDVALQVAFDECLSSAHLASGAPVVRWIALENRAAASFEDLELAVGLAGAAVEPWRVSLRRLPGGGTYSSDEVELALDRKTLDDLRAAEQPELWIEVRHRTECLVRESWPLEILAEDEWAGLRSLPETLAAFVRPAASEVASIVSDAAVTTAAVEGYAEPAGLTTWIEALWQACARRGAQLDGREGLASGGTIQDAETLFEGGPASALDLALVFAACLERAHLHPLILVGDEAVLVGAWLVDDTFPTATLDDSARVRRRIERGELCLFDAAGLAAGAECDPQAASARALACLEDPERFVLGVDVAAARASGVRPLDGTEESAWHTESAEPAASDPQVKRIETWKRRLLDLTLRNRFLNFVPNRKTVAIKVAKLEDVYTALSEGEDFTILTRARQMSAGGARAKKDDTDYLAEQLKKKNLRTLLDKKELDRRLLEIYRAARLSVEETGANVLYLALGFLAWQEPTSGDRTLLAPILLLPLTMKRLSAKKGFVIRLADEDPRVNVTLLEKLGSEQGIDVSGLRDVTGEDGSISVAKILASWNKAIAGKRGWEIVDQASLGLFSFTKFLMWRDLEELGDRLRDQPVLRYLIERPSVSFDDQPFPDPTQLDLRGPAELLLPMDADSSQIAAVVAAEEGKSFILEGPPGTGKSQTITNLIAHCLTRGKRVLFVAEKKAALSVVRDRLCSVGLGPFCLELHSSKANKQEVLEQLRETLDVAASQPPDGWNEHAERLQRLRVELNGYVEELHVSRPIGRSLRRMIERQIELEGAPLVPLEIAGIEALTSDDYHEVLERVDRLASAAIAVGDPSDHPLRGILELDWDRELPQKVTAAIESVREALDALDDAHERVARLLGRMDEQAAQVAPASHPELDALGEAARLFRAMPVLDGELLPPESADLRGRIADWIACENEVAEARAQLAQRYQANWLAVDSDGLRGRIQAALSENVLVRPLKLRKLRKELAPYAVDGSFDARAFLAALDELDGLRRQEGDLELLRAGLLEELGPDWHGFAYPHEVADQLAYAERIETVLVAVAGEDVRLQRQLARRWYALATNERGVRSTDGFEADLLGYTIALEGFHQAWNDYITRIRLDVEHVILPDQHGFLARVREHVTGWETNSPELRDWLLWQRARNAAMETWAAPLVDAFEHGAFEAFELPRALERSFNELFLKRMLELEGPLADFHGIEHGRKVQRFRELDAEWIQLTRGLLRAKLGAGVATALREPGCAEEIGLLERELRKKRQIMPIRRFFEKMPNLLPRLKPCVLMSPLAAAQYLEAEGDAFDLVVFDEASQIPIWDAVGAITRGKQVVIVGDSRQLPPTNFFASLEEEDDVDDDDMEELDSLLEECVASRLPSLQLRWHYRSRHESLIAFSNQRYYANRLVTFPSPSAESEELGVRFRFVEGGVQDRGDTSTNRVEAEAIVAEAVSILKRPRKRGAPAPSLGIVTFSLPQQRLVEELLDEARAQQPELDAWFGEDNAEPVFVKNLESVQGDERDVILLGVGFGPDAKGRLSMNFGPLCREGGERRLNVAVTRARRRLLLFSSLRAADIDLARTRATGAKHLKAFLDFAERGGRALAPTLFRPGPAPETALEDELYRRLSERGHTVDRHVGCSEFRIDLAIRHPEHPQRYALGIECDGEGYRAAATARDRDRLRQSVLDELGWRLHRVWALDWWMQDEREVERIEAALQAALDAEQGIPRVRIERAA